MTKNQPARLPGLKYRNITISGIPGAGSTTLAKALSKVLGWKYFSGGDYLRAYAIKKGAFDPKNQLHHDQSILEDASDLEVDFGMRKTLQTETASILDSWLSGFMAQGVEGTLKILVFCSDPALRVDRIANRDNITISQAKTHIFEREEKNLTKWRHLYAKQWKRWVVNKGILAKTKPIWFWYPELYDLTIDTYRNSKQETLQKALRKIGVKNLKFNYTKIFPSR